ncbi:MAG: tetratricopeptide repeat protein, partial [Candidatus Eisenbacteria bacterium]|nr:tetratricopeptide repeat protein [Candidatus Eisenbacteria bacterium]
ELRMTRGQQIEATQGDLDRLRDLPAEAPVEPDRAPAIDPGTPEAHLRLGTLSLASGRPAEALREFAHPGAAPAHDPRVEFGRALACMQLGDTAHARAALLRVLKRDPANAIARRMLSDTEGGASSR